MLIAIFKQIRKVFILLPLFLINACHSPVQNVQANKIESPEAKAERLTQEFLLVDTHIDVPYRLFKHWEEISGRTEKGHFDYDRAKKGGLNVPFMSIYVSASFQQTGGAKEEADKLIDLVYGFAQKWPDKYVLAFSSSEVMDQFSKGLISLPMGMENGAPIGDDIGNLRYFYERGIRYITLCHSKWNQICDSSYDPDKHWNGLSPFGKEVVEEMNRLGILIDISHVSDSTYYQILKISKAPVVATHSSCRHFTPGFERNMSDDMIRKLATNGGVIQINFGSYFINGEHQSKMSKIWDVIDRSGMSEPEKRAYREQYVIDNDVPIGKIEEVADHIDHIVDMVGIDHVGFGSDFDGVDYLPEGLEDVSMYPNLIRILLERGYTEEDILKIMSGNFIRIWKEVELLAENMQENI